MENNTPDVPMIHTGETAAFEHIFKIHFKGLYAYACSIVKDETVAEDIVQHMFYKLWEKNGQIAIKQSIAAYLYRSVYHDSLNYLKHLKVKASYKSHAAYHMEQNEKTSDTTAFRELEQKLQDALNQLPEKCRTIFQLSRFEELKYQEIATRLDISVKTVENQMGKALRILRLKLVDFLPLLLWLFVNM